jgi:hypothetical protein
VKSQGVIDAKAKTLGTCGKAFQGLLPKVARAQAILVHTNSRQERQAAGAAKIEKTIKVTTRPIHLLPCLGPGNAARGSDRTIGSAPLSDRRLLQELN